MAKPETFQYGALKSYALKLVDSVYHASVYTILGGCLLLFVLAIIAMAISLRMIYVPEFHPT